MLGLVLILVDFKATHTLGHANFPVTRTHPDVRDGSRGKRLAWEREAVVTREPTKVLTNQGSAHDGPETGAVTWETCVVLLESGSRF